MGDMFKISQSKVKVWRRCRQAYHYKYVENLRRKAKSRPLMFGTIVHRLIETDINGDSYEDELAMIRSEVDSQKLFAVEKDEMHSVINDAELIMTEYFEHWADQPLRFFRKRGRSAEHSFEIELLPGILWTGKIDAIASDGGLRYLVEHKSFNRRPSDDDRWRNLQSVSYFRAIEMLGWRPVDGTLWDYIWSKAPAMPGLLKDGTMSRKSIDTLPSAVDAAIKKHKLKRSDYRGMIDSVTEQRSKWFFRIKTPVDKDVATSVFNDFVSSIQEMHRMHGLVQERNIDRHCSWCDFEPLCRAFMQGHDFDFIKERQYETNSKPHEDEGAAHSVTLEDN